MNDYSENAEVLEVLYAARDWFDACLDVWQKSTAPAATTAEQHVRLDAARSIANAECYKAELRLLEAVSVFYGRDEFRPDDGSGEEE